MKILIVLCALSLSSCAYFFNEKPRGQATSFSFGSEQDCVADFFANQYGYLAGQTYYAHAVASANCAQDSLAFIEKFMTGGEQKHSFSKKEIHQILNQLFFQEDPVKESLVFHAITLKSWFIGGNRNSITKLELKQTIDTLNHWKVFLLNIKPHLSGLHLQYGQGSQEDFDKAYANTRAHLEVFLSYLPKETDPFDMGIVRKFFLELGAYRGSDDLSKYMDLLHGMIWIVNGREDFMNTTKTFTAFFLFLQAYNDYNYKFEDGFGDIVSSPLLFINWLGDTIDNIGEALGDDYSLHPEAIGLILNFLVEYMDS